MCRVINGFQCLCFCLTNTNANLWLKALSILCKSAKEAILVLYSKARVLRTLVWNHTDYKITKSQKKEKKNSIKSLFLTLLLGTLFLPTKHKTLFYLSKLVQTWNHDQKNFPLEVCHWTRHDTHTLPWESVKVMRQMLSYCLSILTTWRPFM